MFGAVIAGSNHRYEDIQLLMQKKYRTTSPASVPAVLPRPQHRVVTPGGRSPTLERQSWPATPRIHPGCHHGTAAVKVALLESVGVAPPVRRARYKLLRYCNAVWQPYSGQSTGSLSPVAETVWVPGQLVQRHLVQRHLVQGTWYKRRMVQRALGTKDAWYKRRLVQNTLGPKDERSNTL